MSNSRRKVRAAAIAMATGAMTAPVLAIDPFADAVESYDPGVVPVGAYNDPARSLGRPADFSPAGQFSTVVSMFAGAYQPSQLAGIGEGGSLVVEFDEPIFNDPANPFGIDLIVFGNGAFIDIDYPNGRIDGSASLFGLDPMQISVSADGVSFEPLGDFTEGFFPTQAYRDVGPQSDVPGSEFSDFTRPMDPALTPGDFANLNFAQAMALYDGSGGGTPIDIGPSGLSSVRFVRIDVPNVPDEDVVVEIDALAAVPEPGSAVLVALVVVGAALRRKLG